MTCATGARLSRRGATAAAFGRRAFVTDLAIGGAAGLLIYLLFAKLLSLTLPTGPLERLI